MNEYPLTYESGSLRGPTLFYVDSKGETAKIALTDSQAQGVIDDWNLRDGDKHARFDPPLVRPCVSGEYSPDGPGAARPKHAYPATGDTLTCIHCGESGLERTSI